MSQIVYLNGNFMPLDEARVPVLDRGFIFGDGVYEVIPVYAGRPFRLEEHLCRLHNSLDGIRLANPYSDGHWAELLDQLIARNEGEHQYIYLHITRGVAKRDHAFPDQVTPTIFLMSTPLMPPPASLVEGGITAVSAQDNRWGRCDIKAIALLANILLRQLAVEQGAVETVLFRDGLLTEGAASNIFVVERGVLLAPGKDHRILPGITYDVVLELARAHGLPVVVGDITEAQVRHAAELWLTSSTKEVLAIVSLDGKPVGQGMPGEIFRQMHAWYQTYKKEVMCAPHA